MPKAGELGEWQSRAHFFYGCKKKALEWTKVVLSIFWWDSFWLLKHRGTQLMHLKMYRGLKIIWGREYMDYPTYVFIFIVKYMNVRGILISLIKISKDRNQISRNQWQFPSLWQFSEFWQTSAKSSTTRHKHLYMLLMLFLCFLCKIFFLFFVWSVVSYQLSVFLRVYYFI